MATVTGVLTARIKVNQRRIGRPSLKPFTSQSFPEKIPQLMDTLTKPFILASSSSMADFPSKALNCPSSVALVAPESSAEICQHEPCNSVEEDRSQPTRHNAGQLHLANPFTSPIQLKACHGMVSHRTPPHLFRNLAVS